MGSSLTFCFAVCVADEQGESRRGSVEWSIAERYHVIKRGNYRAWVFREQGARNALEACLYEAAERYGWVMHAWVIMSNHFHLAFETPSGNLVPGMQWLRRGAREEQGVCEHVTGLGLRHGGV